MNTYAPHNHFDHPPRWYYLVFDLAVLIGLPVLLWWWLG